MIDLAVYRARIGIHNANSHLKGMKSLHPSVTGKYTGSILDRGDSCISSLLFLFYIIVIMYFIIYVQLLTVDLSSTVHPSLINNRLSFVNFPASAANSYNRCFLVILVMHVIRRYLLRNQGNLCGLSGFLQASIRRNIMARGSLGLYLTQTVLWTFGVNFCLIAIANPGIVNPGLGCLKVLFQNVQGLIPFGELNNTHPALDQTKCFEFSNYLRENVIDIAVLNETWLKKSVRDSEILSTNQYKIFRKDRSSRSHPPDPSNPNRYRRNGGGVLIAVRTDLNLTSKEIKLGGGSEISAVEFTLPNGAKFIVCTCYRVGTLGMENHNKIVNSLRTLIRRRNLSKLFVIGDFNLQGVCWDTAYADSPVESAFVDSFIDLGLTQCVNQPTHRRGNLLDIVLTNAESSVRNLKILDENSVCRSDHFPLEFNIGLRVGRTKAVKRVCYNFKTANWDGLNYDLCHTNWDAMLNSEEPDLAWLGFKTRLFQLADVHIRKATVKSDGQDPWFDSECHDLWLKKNRLRAKAKRTKSEIDEINFRLARKDLQKLINLKMRQNLNEDDSSDLITKKFWSYVKTKSGSSRIPEFVSYLDSVRSDPVDQANLFNEFFYEQFSDASSYDIDIDYARDREFDIDFDHRRIRLILSKIKTNKAHGPDGIHGKILKHCAVGLAYPLSLLFRLSYNTGVLPGEWKLGHVVPILKKGNKHEVSNYRPISLTSLVMKTFERVIKDEILQRVDGLIDERQHGFLSRKSCTTNLIGMCDSLALSLENSTCTDIVYFDFAKAFDSVNHDLILHKLKNNFHIDGRLLKFIANYLRDRKQQVLVASKLSTAKPVRSGVPQGSILGPLLFVLFINDLYEGISVGTEVSLYADDTKIYRPIHTGADNIALQKDIDYLHDWSLRNLMRFHPSKCKVLQVTGRIRAPLLSALPFYSFVYYLGGESLDYVDVEKDLGVMVTSSLGWKDQCDKVYSKANQNLGLSRRSCHFLVDMNRKRVIYLTLVRSQFEHCSIIWRPTTKSLTKKFEDLQKRALKWILAEEYTSYISHSHYILKCRQVNIMPMSDRFDFLDLLFFFKVVKGRIGVELPSYITLYTGNSRLRSSHMDHLCYVSSTTARSDNSPLSRSFFYRTAPMWNRLPIEIRECSDMFIFKKWLSLHMWERIMSTVDEIESSDENSDSSIEPEN